MNSTRTSYAASLGSNGNQDCGGGNASICSWQLTAADAARNSVTTDVYGGRIRLTQDDNLADHSSCATRPTVAYGGPWSVGYRHCWSDGSVHKRSTAGATATITPTQVTAFASFATNHLVGLVMTEGRPRIDPDVCSRTRVPGRRGTAGAR